MYALKLKEAQDYHLEKTGVDLKGKVLCKFIPGDSTDSNKQFLLSRWAHGDEMQLLNANEIVALSEALDYPKHLLMGCKYTAEPCCEGKRFIIYREAMAEGARLKSFLAGAVSVCNKYKVGPDLLFVDEKSSGSCNCKTDK